MTIKEIRDALKNFEISHEKALFEIDSMYDKINLALKRVSLPDPKIDIGPNEILLYPNGITLDDYWQHPLSPQIRRDFAEYLKETGYDLDDVVELLSFKETIVQIIAEKHRATTTIKEKDENDRKHQESNDLSTRAFDRKVSELLGAKYTRPGSHLSGEAPETIALLESGGRRGMTPLEIRQALARGEISPERALGEAKAMILEIDDKIGQGTSIDDFPIFIHAAIQSNNQWKEFFNQMNKLGLNGLEALRYSDLVRELSKSISQNITDNKPLSPEPATTAATPGPLVPEQFRAGVDIGYLKPRADGNYDLNGISAVKFFRSLIDQGLPMDSPKVFEGKLYKNGAVVKNIDQKLTDVRSGRAGKKAK